MTDGIVRLVPADDFEDEPPRDGPEVIAERAVLGTAIQSTDAAAEALVLLRPEFFSRSAHRVVFEAVERLADAGVKVEPASVMTELARAGMLAKVRAPGMGDGGVFLHSLAQHAGSIAYHAPVVIAAARQRNIGAALASCQQINGMEGFDPDTTPEQVRKIVEDATAYAEVSPLRTNSETVLEVLDDLENAVDPGLPTGYPDLDDAIGGLRPGEVIVIGGRPGDGKTLVALCIADHVASHVRVPVLFASLEMTEEELTRRRIAAAAKVPVHDLVKHQVSDAQWERICQVRDRLQDTLLFVDDTDQAPLGHIRGQLRAMARTGSPARLLVIDYLGFMAAPRAESRQQAVAALTKGVKGLAREFAIPVILLAQLNRGPESRADKVPVLADLRESGEIEQTAHIVIMLHREDVHNPESPRAGEIDLLIRKNRQGPLTTVTLLFQGHYGRVVSLRATP